MEKNSIWGPVAAIGSLVGGVGAILAIVWPKSEPAPAPVAPPSEQTAPVALMADAPSMMRQASVTDQQEVALRQLVGRYLDATQTQYGAGMVPAPGFQDGIADLQPGGDARWQLHLQAGTPYRIIGACDNECSNVDLELIDSSGAVVASDALPDDYPIVDHTPAAAGIYQIRVMMMTCTLAPCYAGARVLSGTPAAAN